MALRPPKELLEFLKSYDRGVQELALALRQLVLEEMAPCCEYILQVYIVSLVYGQTHRVKDSICYIGVIQHHVNLGFMRGADLSDPQGILEGTGKQMRHIKIKNIEDLMQPAVRSYLQEACERGGHEVATDRAKTVNTVVKPKGAPKRSIGITRL